MKIQANTANAKRAHIQSLLYLGLEPKLMILEADVPAARACEREAHWIDIHHHSRYLLNCTAGGEGFRGNSVSIYALCDPRSEQVFYVGMAADVNKRFKQHIDDALEIVAVIDRVERQRMSWTPAERDLIYSGADPEVTAHALGRTLDAVRSHYNLSISSNGRASNFVIESLKAALRMRRKSKLNRSPTIRFYDEEAGNDKYSLGEELLNFAKELAAG